MLPIVIIGSGHAGLSLATNIRKANPSAHLVVVCADDGADYSKPLLSHAFSNKQTASDLIRKDAPTLRQELRIALLANTEVTKVNTVEKNIQAGERTIPYGALVLATGARAFIPPMHGAAVKGILTLNSLQEYENARSSINDGANILVIGGGLIGTEIAHDLAKSGFKVTICDPGTELLSGFLPTFAAVSVTEAAIKSGINFIPGSTVGSIGYSDVGYLVHFTNNSSLEFDNVISAAGLRPRIELAQAAGIDTARGIVVDEYLQTSAPDVYAIGDVAEINGSIYPYLQPISACAVALAKTLTGEPTSAVLRQLPVNVKTPAYPLQFAGNARDHKVNWELIQSDAGYLAKGWYEGKLVAYIAAGDSAARGLALFREIQA